MTRHKYYCSKCKHNHYYDSKIGKKHINGTLTIGEAQSKSKTKNLADMSMQMRIYLKENPPYGELLGLDFNDFSKWARLNKVFADYTGRLTKEDIEEIYDYWGDSVHYSQY